jgi:hypothetical protein
MPGTRKEAEHENDRTNERRTLLKAKTIAAAFIVTGFILVLVGQACSEYAGYSQNSVNAQGGDVEIFPATATINPGAQIQLRASGGSGPYNFGIAYGPGSITPGGLFTAPASVAGNAVVTTIACTDDAGLTGYASVSINANSLAINFTPSSPNVSQAIALSVMGGTPAYTYQLISGRGTLSGSTYSAPSTPETALINVIDAMGRTASVSIPIGVGSGTNKVSGVTFLAATTCPTGSTNKGELTISIDTVETKKIACVTLGGGTGPIMNLTLSSTATCANASDTKLETFPICSRNGSFWSCPTRKALCASYAPSGTLLPLSEFVITAGNKHTSTNGCAAGFTAIGTVPDCYGTTCNGIQTLCIKR